MTNYIENSENPINCCPPLIKLKVTLSSDTTIYGMDSAWVKCEIDYERFEQGDSRWGNDIYDTYINTVINNDTTYFKIRQKGCALTCMAMILKANNIIVDPDVLNKWMIKNTGYTKQSSVKWFIINDYPNNDIIYYYNALEEGLNSGLTISLSIIDQCLAKCYYIIAQVKNTDTEKNHWIIIEEKNGSTYNIVDPGKNRTTLNSYDDNIYRMIIYKDINNCGS